MLRYPELCSQCAASNALGFAAMYGGWLVNGVLYLIFAVLNAEAATSNRPSVHTVLIRVAISWGTAVSLLGEFELSRIPLFEFSRNQFDLEQDEDEDLVFSCAIFLHRSMTPMPNGMAALTDSE